MSFSNFKLFFLFSSSDTLISLLSFHQLNSQLFSCIIFTLAFDLVFFVLLKLRYRDMKAFGLTKGKNTYGKKNWITKWAETNWKWTDDEHLSINTLFESLPWQLSLRLVERSGNFFISLFCNIVKLIRELRHTFFINLRLQQKLNLWPSTFFYKNLYSAAGTFVQSAFGCNTCAPYSGSFDRSL